MHYFKIMSHCYQKIYDNDSVRKNLIWLSIGIAIVKIKCDINVNEYDFIKQRKMFSVRIGVTLSYLMPCYFSFMLYIHHI